MSNKIKNPLGSYAVYLTLFLMAYIGLQHFLESELLGAGLKPLLFISALFFCFWISFQYKTGQISLYSPNGSKNTYHKTKDPIMFHLIVITGILMGVFLSVVVASDIFFSCEYSLINSCQRYEQYKNP